MNVKELIEKYKRLEGVWNAEGAELARQIFLQDLEQLDERQPVKVPQFVAEYIEWTKKEGFHLLGAMNNMNNQGNWKGLKDWLYTYDNIKLFARAWLDGYEVEEEKRYYVKMLKANFDGKIQILSFKKNSFFWSSNWECYKTHHTRKELEEANFGWVFDCPGIEIEEVE